MSEVYSDVDEEESIQDEQDDDYGDEFEAMEDDIGEGSPQTMTEDAFSPIEVPKTQSIISNNDYDDEYEEDVEENEEPGDDDDNYDDDYDEDDDELKESSVMVAGETDDGEVEQPKPEKIVQNQQPNISNVASSVPVKVSQTNKTKDSSEVTEDENKKKKKKAKRMKSKSKKKHLTPLQPEEPKTKLSDPIVSESTENLKPKSILKKNTLSSSTEPSRTVGAEEKILKEAVNVALDILNGGEGGGTSNSKENEPVSTGGGSSQLNGSHRKRIPFKGETPITSSLKPTPLNNTQQPLSRYQALLSEITTRSARSRTVHSPSGFDLRGLEESKAEAKFAESWRPDEAWAADALKQTSNRSKREQKKKKKKFSTTKGRSPTMIEREAASRAKLMEEYLKSTAPSKETEHVPIGVPGVREIKKSYVYDIHGRKTSVEEFEAAKARAAEEKKKIEEGKKEREEKAREAQKLLPPKTVVRKMGELQGNIKQAYDHYVKQRKEQVAQMNDIVGQFRAARLHWLDMRVEDIFPSPGDSQAQKDALLAATTTNYGEAVKWPMYGAIEEGDVIISIEAKTSWRAGQSPYTRHNPNTYKDAVSALWRNLLEAFRGRVDFRIAIEVCGGFGEKSPKRVKHIAGRPEPRLGSFEVQVAYMKDDRLFVEPVFSKLQSHHWPHTGRLTDKIIHLLTKKGFKIDDAAPKQIPPKPIDDAAVEEVPPEPIADWKMALQSGSSSKAVVWLINGRNKTKPDVSQSTSNPLSNTALNVTSELNVTATTATTCESPPVIETQQLDSGIVAYDAEKEEEKVEVPLELSEWLQDSGPQLVKYATMLIQAGFDSLTALSMMSEEDKQYFPDIKIGHWKLLMESIQKLQKELRRDKEEEEREKLLAIQKEVEEKLAQKQKEEEEAAEILAMEKLAQQKKEEEEALLAQKKREEESLALLKKEQEARRAQQQREEEERAAQLAREAAAAEQKVREAEEKAAAAQKEREKAAALKKAEEEAVALAAQYAREAEEKAALERAEELKLKKAEAKKAAKLAKKAAKKAKHAEGESAQRAQQELELATNAANGMAAELEELSTKQAEDMEMAIQARNKACEELAELATKKREEEEAAERVAKEEAGEVERMKQEAEEARIKAQKTKKQLAQKKKAEEAKKKAEEEAAAAQKLFEEEEAAKLKVEQAEEEMAVKDISEDLKARQEEEEEAAKFFEEEEAKYEVMVMPDSWIYVDNHGNTQGPFSSEQMSQWAPFFKPETKVAPIYDGAGPVFAQISELFPDSSRAFLDPPIRPTEAKEEVSSPTPEKANDDEGDDYGDDFEKDEHHHHEEEAEANVAGDAGKTVENDYEDGEFEEEEEYSMPDDDQPSQNKVSNEVVINNAKSNVEEEYGEEEFEEEQPDNDQNNALVEEEVIDEPLYDEEVKQHSKKKDKHATDASSPSSLCQGAVVEARYQKGPDWFRGKVAKVHSSGKVDISYDDGDFEANVKPKYVRLVEVEEEVEEVELIPEPEPVVEATKKSRSKKHQHDSSSNDVAPKAQVQQEVSVAAPPSQNPDTPFHACINALQCLRVSMNQSGLNSNILFSQFLECGKKKNETDDVREFLSLTDFKNAVKKNYRDQNTEPILGLKNSAWADDGEDHSGDAVLAMLDLSGTGQISLQSFEIFLKGDNLALIWEQIRSGVKQSSKLSCDMLDTQLFARYDKSHRGYISRDELKRALKHIKHMEPLSSDQLSELASSFAMVGDIVNYVNMVSWLNPVRIDKTSKKAARVIRAILAQQGINSISRASEEEMACVMDSRDFLGLSELKSLLSENAGSTNVEEFSLSETRALLLHVSSTPFEMLVRPDGILRIAKNLPYTPSTTNGNSSFNKHDHPISLEGAPTLAGSHNNFDRGDIEFGGQAEIEPREQRSRSSRPKSAGTKSSSSRRH